MELISLKAYYVLVIWLFNSWPKFYFVEVYKMELITSISFYVFWVFFLIYYKLDKDFVKVVSDLSFYFVEVYRIISDFKLDFETSWWGFLNYINL